MPHLSSISNRIRRRPITSFRKGTTIGGGGSGGLSTQTPTGAIDGVNADFELPYAPTTLFLYLNGVLQTLGDDYTLSGTTITFVTPPVIGDTIQAVTG